MKLKKNLLVVIAALTAASSCANADVPQSSVPDADAAENNVVENTDDSRDELYNELYDKLYHELRDDIYDDIYYKLYDELYDDVYDDLYKALGDDSDDLDRSDYDFGYKEEEKELNGLIYTVNEENEAVIKSCSGGEALEIPEEIDGAVVVEIAPFAFFGNDKIKSVSIPETVKQIGEFAFYHCNMLSDINYGNTTEVERYAFCGCPGTKITYDFDPDVSISMSDAEVFTGYNYGEWTTVESINSDNLMTTGQISDTVRIVADGYTYVTGTDEEGNPKTRIEYQYIKQSRSKTEKYETKEIPLYNYVDIYESDGEVIEKTFYNQRTIHEKLGEKKPISEYREETAE